MRRGISIERQTIVLDSNEISITFDPKYTYFIRKQIDEMLLKSKKGELKNITK
jgi:hypothetical protein